VLQAKEAILQSKDAVIDALRSKDAVIEGKTTLLQAKDPRGVHNGRPLLRERV
jgi:hypothetical protein